MKYCSWTLVCDFVAHNPDIIYRDVIISQLTDEFLNVVDNIINVDVETLQESQESSNTSAM